ncbi:MAG: MmcQ/YjbR family DNA-binding protein, partial [bacterium]
RLGHFTDVCGLQVLGHGPAGPQGARPKQDKTADPSQIHSVPPSPLPGLRQLCLALPDTTEVKAWGEPTFRVHNRLFAMYADGSNDHGGGRHSVWLNCTQTNQMFMIADNPKRFFKPAYVGPYGWVGMYLDGRVSWKLVSEVVRDAYELSLDKVKKKTKTTDRRPRTADRG